MNRGIVDISIVAIIYSFMLGLNWLMYSSIIALFFFILFNVKYRFDAIDFIKSRAYWSITIIVWISVIGMSYTTSQNYDEGLKYLERLIVLTVFPPMIYALTNSNTKIDSLNKILKSSILVVFFIGLVNSIIHYKDNWDQSIFYSNNLLQLFDGQAVYYSIYINLVLSINLINLRQKSLNHEKWSIELFFLTVCFAYQLLLSSRLSLIICVFIIIGSAYYLLKLRLSRRIIPVFILLLIIGVTLLGYFTSSTIINRFKSLSHMEYDITSIEEEYHFQDEEKISNWNGLTIRLAIWECAMDVFFDKPILGVGTGNYKSALLGSYTENGFQYGINKNYGSHNQYIYLLITHGIIGLLIFLISISYLSIQAIKMKDYLMAIFITIFMIAFITENIFNRQYGVFIWTFFMSFGVARLKISTTNVQSSE